MTHTMLNAKKYFSKKCNSYNKISIDAIIKIKSMYI